MPSARVPKLSYVSASRSLDPVGEFEEAIQSRRKKLDPRRLSLHIDGHLAHPPCAFEQSCTCACALLQVFRWKSQGWFERWGRGRYGGIRYGFRRARSRLYRSQILQVNTRWKLSPRSTQCTPLHRSSISKFQPKIVNIFSRWNN